MPILFYGGERIFPKINSIVVSGRMVVVGLSSSLSSSCGVAGPQDLVEALRLGSQIREILETPKLVKFLTSDMVPFGPKSTYPAQVFAGSNIRRSGERG